MGDIQDAGSDGGEQLELVPRPIPPGPARRRSARKPAAEVPLAEVDPVAEVLVDTGLAHLDRPFEYSVPAELDEQARPGVRVRVRFAGRDHDGWVLGRRARAEHAGTLAPLRRVVGAEPVLTQQVLRAAHEVAHHYGGTLGDVLRLAVPARHARAERSVPPTGDGEAVPAPGDVEARARGEEARARGVAAWQDYPAGPALLRRLEEGMAPAAAWTALPGRSGAPGAGPSPHALWLDQLVGLVASVRAGGRGAVVVVPDAADVEHVVPVLELALGPGTVQRLTADLGPEARYRAFLAVLRGHARVVVGTRAAAWAPVVDCGLFVCWDDGDDLHQELRAPYPHVREILRARSRVEAASLVVGGLTRTVQAQAWVREGVLAEVSPAGRTLRDRAPRVVVAGEGWAAERDAAASTARLPSLALRALRDALASGPALVQVPRQGYVVSLTCADCRQRLRCPSCEGPLTLSGGSAGAACAWCARSVGPGGACPACGSTRTRAGGVGQVRTAEELGRAFPGVRVLSSGGGNVLDRAPADPVLVVATPGAEPPADGGYHAVVLLDGWRFLERPDLDAGIEALRRWCRAASLTADAAGPVVLCGVPPHSGLPPVEALVRWDPVGLARRELDERTALGLPPIRRHVVVRGPRAAVAEVVDLLTARGQRPLAPPVPLAEGLAHVVVREGTGGLAAAVREARAVLAARKAGEGLRLVLDGAELTG